MHTHVQVIRLRTRHTTCRVASSASDIDAELSLSSYGNTAAPAAAAAVVVVVVDLSVVVAVVASLPNSITSVDGSDRGVVDALFTFNTSVDSSLDVVAIDSARAGASDCC
jgi:hypothetical protein